MKHERFDDLHDKLLALLDVIETQGNSALARQRFDIMKEFGYDVVIDREDDTNVVPFGGGGKS